MASILVSGKRWDYGNAREYCLARKMRHYWIGIKRAGHLCLRQFVDIRAKPRRVPSLLGPEAYGQGIGKAGTARMQGGTFTSLTNSAASPNLDGKFRTHCKSHQATAGVAVRWVSALPRTHGSCRTD